MVGAEGGFSVPDCRGSGEITALTDSQGKAERPNKQGRKESKQASDLRKHLARCGHAMLLFSPLWTLFCLSTVILTRLHTDTCAAARRRRLRRCWNYVNGLKWRGPNCVFLFVYLRSGQKKKKKDPYQSFLLWFYFGAETVMIEHKSPSFSFFSACIGCFSTSCQFNIRFLLLVAYQSGVQIIGPQIQSLGPL